MTFGEMRIRPWALPDATVMWTLLLAFLEEEAAKGAEAVACHKNAEKLFFIGLRYAEAGYPTLLIEANGRPVAFTLWGPQESELELTTRAMFDMGTYVDPNLRGCGLATKLRKAAIDHARETGHTHVRGLIRSLNPEGIRAMIRDVGAWPTQIVMEALL